MWIDKKKNKNPTKTNEKKATTLNENQNIQNTNKHKPIIVYFPMSVAQGCLIIKIQGDK